MGTSSCLLWGQSRAPGGDKPSAPSSLGSSFPGAPEWAQRSLWDAQGAEPPGPDAWSVWSFVHLLSASRKPSSCGYREMAANAQWNKRANFRE